MFTCILLAGLVASTAAAVCTNNNKEYQVGESRYDDMGCNQCTCMGDDESAAWGCTEMHCGDEPLERNGGCVSSGKFYNIGETWSPDGCNHCFCNANEGGPAVGGCTLKACVERTKKEADGDEHEPENLDV